MPWRAGFVGLFWLACACSSARPPTQSEPSPGLVFPAHFAEGEQDAGTKPEEPAPAATRSTAPPDPEPLRQAEQYEYTFSFSEGETRVVSVRALKYRAPVVTARKMGRFAVELWVGSELVERTRFDFPLLAGEEPRKGRRRPLHEPPSLAGGVLKATLLVPAAERARRAVLVDRATGRETALEWPPSFARPPGTGTPTPSAPASTAPD